MSCQDVIMSLLQISHVAKMIQVLQTCHSLCQYTLRWKSSTPRGKSRTIPDGNRVVPDGNQGLTPLMRNDRVIRIDTPSGNKEI